MPTEKEEIRIKRRLAVPDDASKILKALRIQHEHEKDHFPNFVDHDALVWIAHVIREGYVCLATIDNRMVGSIGALPFSWWWNRQKISYRLEWFCVHPHYEKYDVAYWLIERAKDNADRAGADFIVESLTTNTEKRREKLMRGEGMFDVGNILIYRGRRQSEEIILEADDAN